MAQISLLEREPTRAGVNKKKNVVQSKRGIAHVSPAYLCINLNTD